MKFLLGFILAKIYTYTDIIFKLSITILYYIIKNFDLVLILFLLFWSCFGLVFCNYLLIFKTEIVTFIPCKTKKNLENQGFSQNRGASEGT